MVGQILVGVAVAVAMVGVTALAGGWLWEARNRRNQG